MSCEKLVFDPQSLSFVQSVSLSEFESLKGSVCDVYNVKLMKLWIVSFHAFGVFSSTFHLTSLSVIPLNVCVCVFPAWVWPSSVKQYKFT